MIEVIQAPEIESCLNGCDTISVTYTLEGGEPVTVEVVVSTFEPIVNGKNRYDFNVVEGVNGALVWNPDLGVGASWFYSDGDNIAYLTDDTPCPFGTYTIEEGNHFEAFSVASVCFTSKWQAVEHPIKWELQRKDALVVDSDSNVGLLRMELATTPPAELVVGMSIDYFDSLGVRRRANITNITGNFVTVSNVYVSGRIIDFVIFTELYTNYYIETSVLENGTNEIGTLRTIPNIDGSATIDVHRFLKTKATYQNNFDYTLTTATDVGMSGKYKLKFRECYNFTQQSYGDLTGFRYWTNSAKQIRDLYGSNMAEYVTRLNGQAKFLSVFDKPTHFLGYPFSLSYIASELLLTKTLRRIENGSDVLLIAHTNETIQRLSVSDTAQSVAIQYGTFVLPTFTLEGTLTETKQIKINQNCLLNPVCLSWLNTLGGREHWVFSYNQIHSIDTSVGATFEPYIDDLQNSRSNVFDLQRFEQPKLTLGASVDVEDIRGLKTILSSICVEVLTPEGWIGVRPETGSFKIYESRGTTADIEFTIQLPYTNIQSR
jgi:hypothetical protein